MDQVIYFGVIMLGVAVLLYISWNIFFQWYARKREREAQIFNNEILSLEDLARVF